MANKVALIDPYFIFKCKLTNLNVDYFAINREFSIIIIM